MGRGVQAHRQLVLFRLHDGEWMPLHRARTRRGRKRTPKPRTMVPVADLRAYCERVTSSGQTTWSALAEACGYVWGSRPDIRRLKKTLGVVTNADTGGYRQRVHRSTAEHIVRSLGLDPVDYDV